MSLVEYRLRESVINVILSHQIPYNEALDYYYIFNKELNISKEQLNKVLPICKAPLKDHYETLEPITIIIDFLRDRGVCLENPHTYYKLNCFRFSLHVSDKVYGEKPFNIVLRRSFFNKVLKVDILESPVPEMIFFLYQWKDDNWKCLDSIADCIYRALYFELRSEYEYSQELREQ